MKRLLVSLIFSLVLMEALDAQDSLAQKPVWMQSFGVGSGLIANAHRRDVGYDEHWIRYPKPNFLFYYRAIRRGDENKLFCLNLNLDYRSANGMMRSGGRGGSSTFAGSVKFARVFVGVSRLYLKGKKRGFGIGPGFFVGTIVYAEGDIWHNEFSGMQYKNETTNGTASDVLAPLQLGINLEIQQNLRLKNSQKIALGVILSMATSDGFYTRRATKSVSACVGYVFPFKRQKK